MHNSDNYSDIFALFKSANKIFLCLKWRFSGIFYFTGIAILHVSVETARFGKKFSEKVMLFSEKDLIFFENVIK